MSRSTLDKDWVGVVVHSLMAPGNAAIVMDDQPVFIAVIPSTQAKPEPLDLIAAEWVGVAGAKRACRAMFGPGTGVTFTAGKWSVWAKVDGGDWSITQLAYQMVVNG